MSEMNQATTAERAAEEFDVHEDITAPEAWEDWETKLVLWSLALGIGGLVVLGALINAFIL